MVVIYTTLPTKKSAERVVKIILKNRLAVCINYWPIESQYIWNKKIETAQEWILIIKTINKNYQKIEKMIKNNHPYETPAIFSWSINKVEKNYLRWLEKEIK